MENIKYYHQIPEISYKLVITDKFVVLFLKFLRCRLTHNTSGGMKKSLKIELYKIIKLLLL